MAKGTQNQKRKDKDTMTKMNSCFVNPRQNTALNLQGVLSSYKKNKEKNWHKGNITLVRQDQVKEPTL